MNYDTSTYPYVIVPLSNDFRLDDSAPLNNSSNIVQTINCLDTNGGTAYTTALDQAQAALDAQGRPDAQDVIIFFTDGEANDGPWYYGNNSAYRKQPCDSAISSAQSIQEPGVQADLDLHDRLRHGLRRPAVWGTSQPVPRQRAELQRRRYQAVPL